SGRRRDGAEEIDLEVEHDHVRLHRCDLTGQGPARWGDQETETRAPANHPLETRTHLRPRGDDEDASHGTATPARRREPRTATVGTARARPPWIIAFTPRTRPRSSASGPPEFPGASRRSATSQARARSSRLDGSRWRMPTESAPARPSGWPTARMS